MILKFFEINEKKIKEFKFFLLYGSNKGLIEETINQSLKPFLSKNIYNYEESEVLKDPIHFEEEIFNKSFFDNDKLIIISRASDKIIKFVENIIKKNPDGITIILKSNILEKRSKIRNFFEKEINTICVPFYEDNQQTLGMIAQKFFKEKKISISQHNVNIIVERAAGDRMNLYNELRKIELYCANNKKIEENEIIKLTNLAENFEISELIDTSLAQNKKKTLKILNENNFIQEDCILILRIYLSKLKRLLKIQDELKIDKNIDKAISSFKPPIFWKEKEIVKQQLSLLNQKKIQDLILQTTLLELQIKKKPTLSINVVTNFVMEQTTSVSNKI